MIGMIGIMGCIAVSVCAAISAAVSIVSMAYSIDASRKNKDRMERAEARQEERQAQMKLLQKRQQRKSMLRAAQMAANGIVMDRWNERKDKAAANAARRQVGTRVDAAPRPTRDRGTPVVSSDGIPSIYH